MQIKFFKKEKNFKKDKESLWLNINLCWKLAVGFMFLVLLLSFLFGYYLFRQISQEPLASSKDTSSKVETASKERINRVLKYFSAREQKSNKILNYPASVVDPSL